MGQYLKLRLTVVQKENNNNKKPCVLGEVRWGRSPPRVKDLNFILG